MGTSAEYEAALARGDLRAASQYENYYIPVGGGWYTDTPGGGGKTAAQMAANTHYEYRGEAVSSPAPSAPQATPVSPTFDPKIEANALYSKPMALSVGGYYRMGASPAPIVGPYISGGTVDFIVSFGVPANPEGDRKIYAIYLDNELAWSSAGGGTLPGDGTFAAEPFDFIFKTGTLTQTVCSLETEKYPGDECAYRPQMLLELRGLPYARFMANTGKPVPYVAAEIGDSANGDPHDGINLGTALELIAFSPWANYTSSTFEAVDVTDVVDAILIKDNFTVIQLCQNVTGEYRNLDVVLSDKVRIKDRGSSVTPDFVFDRNSIIGDDKAVTVSRGSATEQRREHELIAIDPDQDYTAVPSLSKIPRDPMVISAAVGKQTTTIPLVIDANTRQALATFSQQYQENARRRVVFKVGAAGYGIEPADLFALTGIADGFDNEVFKCTQTTHGANWVVDVEGEAILRCSIFGGPGDIDPLIDFVELLIGANGADGSTAFVDESLQARTVSAWVNAQIDTSQSKFGTGSALFDGTYGTAISVPDSPDFDLPAAWTFECWVRFNSTSGDQAIFGGGWFPPSSGYLFRFTANTLEWHCFGGTNITGSAWAPGINTWYHVAVDRDGTTTRIYADGVMIGSTTGPQSGIPTVDFTIGCQYAAGGGRQFNGWIDEFRYTRGFARYGSDSGFAVPTAAFPRP